MVGTKKTKVTREAKASRADRRRALGTLRDNRVQTRTLNRYRVALVQFFMWHTLMFGDKQFPEDVETVDHVLADYAEHLWQENESRYLFGDTLSGLCHYIRLLRFRLPDAWRQYDTWGRLEPSTRATPLSLDLLLALVGIAFSRKEGNIGAGMLLAFQALLRTGELLAIIKADVTFDVSKGIAIINLGLTKSGKRRNEAEKVLVADKILVTLLQVILAPLRPGDRLMPPEAVFRRTFAQYVGLLQLQSHGYLPYSLRRGGATHLFLETGCMSTVQARGRWVNARTAKLYVDECVTAIKEAKHDTKQRHLASTWAAKARAYFLP